MQEMNYRRYEKLRKEVEELKRESDRADGAYEQLKEKLKEEFDCDTIKQAKGLLLRLRKEARQANKKAEAELEAFSEKWEDWL